METETKFLKSSFLGNNIKSMEKSFLKYFLSIIPRKSSFVKTDQVRLNNAFESLVIGKGETKKVQVPSKEK